MTITFKRDDFLFEIFPVEKGNLKELEEFSSTDFDIESGSSGGYIVRLDL